MEDRGREGLLEGRAELVPGACDGWAGLGAREAHQGVGEVVGRRLRGVGLDAHEDREPVEQGREGLARRAVGVLRGNKTPDGRDSVCREEVEEEAQALGEGVVRDREVPVGELGHVAGRDREDVQEAQVAPGREGALEEVGSGGRVEAHDGVGHVELVLLEGGRGRREVEGREVAVVVREGLGELVGLNPGVGLD